MKKTTRFLAVAIVAVMLLTMLPLAAFAKSTALAGKTIVAFGDSLTRFGSTTIGGSTSSTGAYTYPYYLGTDDYLGVPIINAGVGGNTTVHARARFETDVLSQNPDLVIMCFGMNDQAMSTTTGDPLTDMATYRTNLIYMAETLKAAGSDVVFVTPNPVNSNEGYYTTISYNLNYAGGYLDDFCNIMREVAIETQCTLVDINYECDFEDMNKFCAAWDGIHHSDYGRRQYAYYIDKHLEAVYDGANKAVMTLNCVDENGNTLKTVTFTGAAGAHFTIASPVIRGYSPIDADIQTTFVNGKTYTIKYSFDLNDYINAALSVNALEYNEVIIEELRKTVADAKELMASGTATQDELTACSDKIAGLLKVKGAGEYVASNNKSYTTDGGTAHSNYPDNLIRLTDGVIATDGGSNHSGWSGTVNVTVDLGEATNLNTFRAFLAGGQWGISVSDSLEVSYSNDNESFTLIGTDAKGELMTNTIVWDTYSFTIKTEEPINARYIKFTIDPPYESFVWLSEVQASLAVGDAIGGSAYISDINKTVVSGSCMIFTPDFGEITVTKANHAWTTNVLATWSDSENAYVVDSVTKGSGGSTPAVTLNDNQIFIASHDWESDVTDGAVVGSAANNEKIASLKAGDIIEIPGVDVENSQLGVAPYIYIEKLDVETELASGAVENPSSFWVTHFNDASLEGVGVIFTEKSGGAPWWITVAFAPVSGYDNVYEIVELVDGTPNGSGRALNVPEGGFVWSGNYGNNYPALYAADPVTYAAYADATAYPNYTNQGAQTSVGMAKSWKVGQKYVVDGIDFDFKSIPTSTPSLNWFDNGYTCTATINPYTKDDAATCKHNYVAVVTDPDCTNGGYTTYTCDKCGDSYTSDETPANGHNHKPVVTDPDCTNGGYTTHTCDKCGDSYITDETPANGHTEGEWETLEDGSQELRCSVCGELLDTIPAPVYAAGDVNADGSVDMFDYLVIKNIYFKKYTPDEGELARADLTDDGLVDIFDYLMLKSMIVNKG